MRVTASLIGLCALPLALAQSYSVSLVVTGYSDGTVVVGSSTVPGLLYTDASGDVSTVAAPTGAYCFPDNCLNSTASANFAPPPAVTTGPSEATSSMPVFHGAAQTVGPHGVVFGMVMAGLGGLVAVL